ncbi:MAG: multiheme c-type cytochrome [Candidatus Poribacteria bacterium]|nr:multiheme c-type cytochrome [Candidatus Poribacteria bacterium]
MSRIVRLAVLAWLTALVSCGGGAAGPGESAPPEEPAAATFHVDNENCASCHVSIYEEWLQSRHAQAWKSDLFKLTSDNYTKKECLPCHAPALILETGLANKPELRNEYRGQGVDCIACHQDPEADEWVMHGPYGADSPAHGTVQNAAFTTAEVCASCHGHDEEFNQYHSWKESEYGQSQFPCQACHMTPTERLLADTETDYPTRWVGDHSFPGAHNEDVAAAAASVEMERDGAELVVSVTNEAGHFFPGGAYRAAVLQATADGVELGQQTYAFELGSRIASGATVQARFPLPDGAAEAKARLTFYKSVVGDDGRSVVQEPNGILIQERQLELE